jgi:predicted GTPase
MIKSSKPVIAVGAVRTGCGKSQTSRRIIEILMNKGLKVVAVRHPMPYGNLVAQKVQRFATLNDLERHECTIEEMEEYEPHVVRGNVIYAGVDYEAILREAEQDSDGCDIILWDGGNNDFPFYQPDLMITVTDPHRPGHELSYYPGEVTLRIADVVIINKIDSADAEGIKTVSENIVLVNHGAT